MLGNIDKHYLISILLEKGHISNSSTLTEVNESFGNQIFSTEKCFIKISPNVDNLQMEYDSLVLFNSPYIPRVLFYEKISHGFSTYYVLGVSSITGKTLEKYWDKMSFIEKNNLISNLILCIRHIHSLKSGNGLQNICNIWTKNIEQGKYKTHPTIDTESLNVLINKVFLFIERMKDETKYLIHNDIWYKNILIENNEFTGIIDFEMSYLAPIRFEYYGLLLTNYYVFMTECGDSGNFEQDFCKMLSVSIKENYTELLEDTSKEEFIYFCFMEYLKKLGQHNEKWYDHNQTIGFMKNIEIYANTIF